MTSKWPIIGCAVLSTIVIGVSLDTRNQRSYDALSAHFAADAAAAAKDRAERTTEDLKTTEENVSALAQRVTNLEYAELGRSVEATAHIKPSSTTFERLTSGGLTFTATIKNLEKYANGYRLVLAIGNPYALQISDAVASIEF